MLALLFWLGPCGSWFFDETPVPGVTMWHTLISVSQKVMGFVATPAFGGVIHLTAGLVARARERCGWGHALALGLIGLPGIAAAFFCYVIAMNLFNPFAFKAGGEGPEAHMVLPDDGLDPSWSRRVVKLQVVLALVALSAGMWAALARGAAR